MTIRFASSLLTLTMMLLLTACDQESASDPAAGSGEQAHQQSSSTTEPAADATSSIAKADQPCTLTMGYDLWAPYHFEAPDGTVMGIEIDLIRALLADQNCTIEFVRADWVNLLEMIKRGEIDVVPGATAVAGREEYAWFSVPYRQELFEVFVRAGTTLSSRNIVELAASNIKIGLTDGYFYGKLVDLAQQQHPDAFIYSSIAESSMLKLIDGNVGLIVEDPYVVNMIVHQKAWDDEIDRAGIVVANTPVSYMFSKLTTSGEELLDFNIKLAEFLAGQDDDGILANYLGDL